MEFRHLAHEQGRGLDLVQSRLELFDFVLLRLFKQVLVEGHRSQRVQFRLDFQNMVFVGPNIGLLLDCEGSFKGVVKESDHLGDLTDTDLNQLVAAWLLLALSVVDTPIISLAQSSHIRLGLSDRLL